MCNLSLPQTELTPNLIRQATLDLSRSAWSYFHGPFNYDATPIGPLGCDIIAHKKAGTRHSWDFRGAAGWNFGVALHHYPCHKIVAKTIQAAQVSDTVEFRNHHPTQPTVTPMDRIVHDVNILICALHEVPKIACDNKLFTIKALHQAIQRWAKITLPARMNPHRTTLLHTRTQQRSLLRPMRRPNEDRPPDAPTRVAIPKPNPPPQYQHHYHQSQVNTKQLRDTHGPDSPTPWTSHL